MTNEEQKVIEYIEKIVSDCENHWKQLGYTCDLYDGDEPIPVNAYKTVLNLIEKQQKEMFKLQAKVDRVKVARDNWKKTFYQAKEEIEKYKYLYQKALDNTIKADRENFEKDKIIDEMAKIFIKSDYCFEITDHLKCNECINKNIGKQCEKCIKEYFKKKVEDK